MEKKIMTWKTKGMNRDLSVSAFNPEFSFENYNLRLSTNEGNTTLSWVNEKGTKQISLIIRRPYIPGEEGQLHPETVIFGVPIGTAVINHKLVLFTTVPPTKDRKHGVDIIYVLSFNLGKTALIGMVLFQGWLNFDVNYPLETFVSYEAEHIQKVYWTDGLNQPRVINIAAPESHIWRWHYLSDEVDRKEYNYKDSKQPDTFFDFVPSFYTDESVEIRKNETGGMFQPGVIQYCFTYFNKYGQQSNIVYVSPLYYLSLRGGGQDPEKTVTNSFHITISNADRYNFDYIRLYSIQRIATDTAPIVRRIVDLPVPQTYNDAGVTDDIIYTDTGIAGGVIDAMELQYVGGKEIAVLTMAEKDNTLFMGNITEKHSNISKIQDYFYKRLEEESAISRNPSYADSPFIRWEYAPDTPHKVPVKEYYQPEPSGLYSYQEMLDYDSSRITTFKGGDWYRFGFQLQKFTGEWTEPIFLGDSHNTNYPQTSLNSNLIKLAYAKFYNGEDKGSTKAPPTIDWSVFAEERSPYYIKDFYQTYKKVRPLIVFPNKYDREVICQGVLNPTMFNAEDRKSNSPYSQPSWYFRPYVWGIKDSGGSSSQSYFNNKKVTKYFLFGIVPASINVTNSLVIARRKYINLCVTRDNVTETKKVDIEAMFYQGAREISETAPRAYYYMLVLKELPDNNFLPLPMPAAPMDSYKYSVVSEEDVGENNVRYYTLKAFQTFCNGVQVYKNLESVLESNRLNYVYRRPELTAPKEYILTYLDVNGNSKSVTYKSRGETDMYGVDGDALEFRHYYRLKDSTISVPNDAPATIKAKKQIEIEGDVAKYPTVTSSEVSGVHANTDFFVDQSILTLNSPEIEYGDIQDYNGEDLYINIIGLIPITSSASSHRIELGSSMLETGHGYKEKHILGKGEADYNVYYGNRSVQAGNHFVSDYIWNDVYGRYDNDEFYSCRPSNIQDYLVYPWQAEGSLIYDERSNNEAASLLKTKKISNTLFSSTTLYSLDSDYPIISEIGSCSMTVHLRENADVYNKPLIYKVYSQDTLTERRQLNYYPNIDKVLYNKDGFKVFTAKGTLMVDGAEVTKNNPVRMRYNSNSHAVLTLYASFGAGMGPSIPPAVKSGIGVSIKRIGEGELVGGAETFWGETKTFQQSPSNGKDLSKYFATSWGSQGEPTTTLEYDFLWLGEVRRPFDVSNRFGGSSREAIRNNIWYVAGKTTDVSDAGSYLEWLYGDTYFQRYDCLKTYCHTEEDTNQNVEILSFMCETRINLDGRYDSRRGQWKNHNVVPENYVKLNDVYSQQDNFFTYKQTDNSDLKGEDAHYPNHITYSKTKETGEDVDTYANVTLASVLELDGDKGKIRSIRKFNDSLIVFQDSAISQIQYNENVQIASTAGVPIEIANSGKVRGYRYLSDSIGCDNKWSIVNTPLGLYFMSSLNKGIYRIGNQLESLSQQKGFNVWCSNNIPEISKEDTTWTPVNMSYFVGYYDRQNQDVLFINQDWCLAYNEAVGEFTSFYDYDNVPFFCNLDNTGLWIDWADLKQVDPEDPQSYIHNYESRIHEHRGGNDYCNFFGEYKGYGMTLVANAEPQRDKIFTNMEFRATVEGEGEPDAATGKYEPYLPFNHIHTWNEYQNGSADLKHFKGIPSMRHYKDAATALERKSTALKRKFRIWRCDIPRDSQRKMDRMRSPWQYIKLWHKSGVEWDKSNGKKVEIHDVQAVYFV